jgi:transcriptional regulator with XRE-family HTH domain
MNTTYEWIKQRRTALGMSQRQLAELAGVSASTISNLENGIRISSENYQKVKNAIRDRQIQLPKVDYLKAQILKEAMEIQKATDEDAIMVLTHLTVHCGKLINELYSKED